jgi:uncharacterized protein YgiM (DUF1202 family)
MSTSKRNVFAVVTAAILAVGAVTPTISRAQGVELVVTSPTLNVRSGPTTADGIIGTLQCGQKVTADAKTSDGAWYRVSFNGQTGFVFAQFAVAGGTCSTGAAAPASAPASAPAAAPAAAPATSGGNSFTVTSATLNVRNQPSTSGAILGKLKQGDVVQATAKTQDGSWLQITYNGGNGYVFAAYTSAGGTAATAQTVAPASAAKAAAPAAAPAAVKSGSWQFELGGHIKETGFLGQMKDVGMSWVKYQVVMPGGAPDVSGIVNAVHGAGLKILIGAIGDRGRASDANYHKEFAAAVAGLASQGVDAIEVWNEPNLDREYGGSGNGQVNPENYANMLREAYGAIKSVNPNVLVIGGATAPTGYYGGNCSTAGCDDKPFVERLAAAGGGAWMDCMGAHHNGTMVGPDQTSGAPVGSSGHHQWYFRGTLDVNWNAFGGKLPICFTELGYVTGEGIGPLPGGFAWGSSITLDNQAQWLARAAQLSRESGKVRIMIIWNIDFRQWDDDPQAGFSIFRPNGGCPACNTLRAVMGR